MASWGSKFWIYFLTLLSMYNQVAEEIKMERRYKEVIKIDMRNRLK